MAKNLRKREASPSGNDGTSSSSSRTGGYRHGFLLFLIGYLIGSFTHDNGGSGVGSGGRRTREEVAVQTHNLTSTKERSTTALRQSTETSTTTEATAAAVTSATTDTAIKKKNAWDSLMPLQHSNVTDRKPMPLVGQPSDTYNYFHHYLTTLHQGSGITNFPELPMWHTWWHFAEAYHNHFARFRGAERVVFMEVGVQSGGKIALLRDYFGPGFEYIGVDINPSTQKFQHPEHPWVHIEIGDSGSPDFWIGMKQKYPHVDIFLDDGGHFMQQQMLTMEHMLRHVQAEGVYICEDLSTSWSPTYGGRPQEDARHPAFLETTMVGLIHKSLDWFQFGYMPGKINWMADEVADGHWPQQQSWWKVIPLQVKHIHYYNQMVVYEKGLTFTPKNIMTVGSVIPIAPSGQHPPTDWTIVLEKLQTHTNSPWKW